jgi:GntR family transcriptional regulator / MocR family aminotransferase
MRRAWTTLGPIALDARSGLALNRQLYLALRDGILAGRWKPGATLPPTRALAAELGVSRNTVLTAFTQLAAEGYVEARVGSGTRVASLSPDALLHAASSATPKLTHRPARRRPRLSRRGRALASVERAMEPGGAALRAGLPARAEFPMELWTRILARRSRRPRLDGFGYAHAAGLPALRREIAGYLGATRGARCDPEQVLVVSGTQAALDLAARMLLDAGDCAWIEEPGYLGARGALLGAGARLVPVPVDEAGLRVDTPRGSRARRAARPRLVYVTPSHQFPTGATMSLPRRLALLARARRTGAWILEDDYDSEYRYVGRPLAALQGLDPAGIVLYLGTFSKVMFPALRVGYLVLPESLVDSFRVAVRLTGHTPPLAVQAALAEFLAEGHLAAHVRRMRLLYAARQARLVEAIGSRLAGVLEAHPSEAGLQLAAHLLVDVDDREVARVAAESGVAVSALSQYHLREPRLRGFLLGYAGAAEREIAPAVEILARAIERVARTARRGR